MWKAPACRDEADVGLPDLSKDPRQALGNVLALIVALSGFLHQLSEYRQLLHHLQHAEHLAASKELQLYRCPTGCPDTTGEHCKA